MTNNKNTIPYKVIKRNADMLTPIQIFNRLDGAKKFLLESSFPHEKKGKYSFIGVNPYKELIGYGAATTIRNLETGEITEIEQETLTYMKENFPKIDIDLPLPFTGGAIGYIGYDSIRQFEDIGPDAPDTLNMPDIHLMLYKNIFVYDHTNETVHLIAINIDNVAESILDTRLDALETMLNAPEQKIAEEIKNVPFEPEISKEVFKERVKKAKEYIHQGDAFQIVLSQRMQAKFDGDPFSFYRKLRKANPSPYMFYIDFENYVVLGASPESLVQTSGRQIITNPIAGTRPRGKTEQEDTALMADLLADEKEIAEHKMLIDLSRNDLGRVCEIGSIKIPTYMKIEKYQHVMHIVSEVSGLLHKNMSSLDALISCLPAGTVSGAPKIRAMQIINELEDKKRAVYGGGIGFISYTHDVNIALAIRSLVVKDNIAYLQAGAGIVFDSTPEKEYQETLHKARSLMEVHNIDLIN